MTINTFSVSATISKSYDEGPKNFLSKKRKKSERPIVIQHYSMRNMIILNYVGAYL
jgi:hypothetical protein